MNHLPEEALIAYAAESQPSAAGMAVEAHLDGCPPCRDRYETILRELANGLDEEESWVVEEPDPVAAQALREQAARNRREDEEAKELLGTLLQDPEAFVWEDVSRKRKYHTGGVVRRLATAAFETCYQSPRHAFHLAETAVAIAEMLKPDVYGKVALAAWRGLAYKQQANALRILGRLPEAIESLDRAERYYETLPMPDFDVASVTYVRASVLFEQQRYDEADRYAAESTRKFLHGGQTDYYARSRHLQGAIAFEKGELARARTIFESLLAYGELIGDKTWIAREALALGNCALELREFANATEYLHNGVRNFRELGNAHEVLLCEWALALVVQRHGEPRRAVSRLGQIRDQFLSLGSSTDAALVTLDLMETFLLLGKPRDIQRAARNIQAIFKNAGMLTGAVTAADYLKRAAAMREVTPSLIEYLRKYLRRVELQPDFAFVPPSL